MTLNPDLTPFTGVVNSEEERRKTEALVALLSTPQEPGTNRVIVAHQHNITEAAGIDLAEGEAAVFWPIGG